MAFYSALHKHEYVQKKDMKKKNQSSLMILDLT